MDLDSEIIWKLVPGLVLVVLLIGVVAALAVRSRGRLQGLEDDWRAFARTRALALTGGSGPAWLDARFGQLPHLRGEVDGRRVEVRPYRRSRSTTVFETIAWVPIVVAGTRGPVPDAELHPDAAEKLAWLRKQRKGVALEVWPDARGGQILTLVWRGLERDATVLDAVIALLVAVAANPPKVLGELPWYERAPWGGG